MFGPNNDGMLIVSEYKLLPFRLLWLDWSFDHILNDKTYFSCNDGQYKRVVGKLYIRIG